LFRSESAKNQSSQIARGGEGKASARGGSMTQGDAPKLWSNRFGIFFLAPGLLWYGAFLAAPLCLVLITGFFRRGPYGEIIRQPALENHIRVWDPLYGEIFLNSILLAAGTAALCLLIALPVVWVTVRATPRVRSWLVFFLVLPFFANFIIRAWALRVFLGTGGPFQSFLNVVGLGHLSDAVGMGPFAVWTGMISNYLPFMALPLLVTVGRFDMRLIDAARDLGATRRTQFFRVVLPDITPGLFAGFLLVFVPALGEFLIPDFLGGASVMLLGNLMSEQFLKARDWPFGAALASQLMVVIALMMMLRRSWRKT
jgi:spermidine/putrescine transport system permease protein